MQRKKIIKLRYLPVQQLPQNSMPGFVSVCINHEHKLPGNTRKLILLTIHYNLIKHKDLSKTCNKFLTRMCIVWTQMMPIKTVPSVPTVNPAFLKASGIAKIPVPMLPFSKWIIVSQFLYEVTKLVKFSKRILSWTLYFMSLRGWVVNIPLRKGVIVTSDGILPTPDRSLKRNGRCLCSTFVRTLRFWILRSSSEILKH